MFFHWNQRDSEVPLGLMDSSKEKKRKYIGSISIHNLLRLHTMNVNKSNERKQIRNMISNGDYY